MILLYILLFTMPIVNLEQCFIRELKNQGEYVLECHQLIAKENTTGVFATVAGSESKIASQGEFRCSCKVFLLWKRLNNSSRSFQVTKTNEASPSATKLFSCQDELGSWKRIDSLTNCIANEDIQVRTKRDISKLDARVVQVVHSKRSGMFLTLSVFGAGVIICIAVYVYLNQHPNGEENIHTIEQQQDRKRVKKTNRGGGFMDRVVFPKRTIDDIVREDLGVCFGDCFDGETCSCKFVKPNFTEEPIDISPNEQLTRETSRESFLQEDNDSTNEETSGEKIEKEGSENELSGVKPTVNEAFENEQALEADGCREEKVLEISDESDEDEGLYRHRMDTPTQDVIDHREIEEKISVKRILDDQEDVSTKNLIDHGKEIREVLSSGETADAQKDALLMQEFARQRVANSHEEVKGVVYYHPSSMEKLCFESTSSTDKQCCTGSSSSAVLYKGLHSKSSFVELPKDEGYIIKAIDSKRDCVREVSQMTEGASRDEFVLRVSNDSNASSVAKSSVINASSVVKKISDRTPVVTLNDVLSKKSNDRTPPATLNDISSNSSGESFYMIEPPPGATKRAMLERMKGNLDSLLSKNIADFFPSNDNNTVIGRLPQVIGDFVKGYQKSAKQTKVATPANHQKRQQVSETRVNSLKGMKMPSIYETATNSFWLHKNGGSSKLEAAHELTNGKSGIDDHISHQPKEEISRFTEVERKTENRDSDSEETLKDDDSENTIYEEPIDHGKYIPRLVPPLRLHASVSCSQLTVSPPSNDSLREGSEATPHFKGSLPEAKLLSTVSLKKGMPASSDNLDVHSSLLPTTTSMKMRWKNTLFSMRSRSPFDQKDSPFPSAIKLLMERTKQKVVSSDIHQLTLKQIDSEDGATASEFAIAATEKDADSTDAIRKKSSLNEVGTGSNNFPKTSTPNNSRENTLSDKLKSGAHTIAKSSSSLEKKRSLDLAMLKIELNKVVKKTKDESVENALKKSSSHSNFHSVSALPAILKQSKPIRIEHAQDQERTISSTPSQAPQPKCSYEVAIRKAVEKTIKVTVTKTLSAPKKDPPATQHSDSVTSIMRPTCSSTDGYPSDTSSNQSVRHKRLGTFKRVRRTMTRRRGDQEHRGRTKLLLISKPKTNEGIPKEESTQFDGYEPSASEN